MPTVPVALFAVSVADLDAAPDGSVIRDSTGVAADIVKTSGTWGGQTSEVVRRAFPGRYLHRSA